MEDPIWLVQLRESNGFLKPFHSKYRKGPCIPITFQFTLNPQLLVSTPLVEKAEVVWKAWKGFMVSNKGKVLKDGKPYTFYYATKGMYKLPYIIYYKGYDKHYGNRARKQLNTLIADLFVPNPDCLCYTDFKDGRYDLLESYNSDNIYWTPSQLQSKRNYRI